MFDIWLVALALSMDAFAVAVGAGARCRSARWRLAIELGAWFGAFQAVMTLAGWLCGDLAREFVAGIDHWIAFFMLAAVGAKMIVESLRNAPGRNLQTLGVAALLALATATSIDAFVTGAGIAMIELPVALPACIIGAVACAMSFAGALLGNRLGALFGRAAETAGGLILIGIGCRILQSHL